MDPSVETSRLAAHAGVGLPGSGGGGRRGSGSMRGSRRRVASKQYCFAVTFTATVLAKLAHLHAHRHSILPLEFLLWGLTFVLSDVLVLLLARALTENWSRTIPRLLGAAIAIVFSISQLFMASITVSFYIVSGAEIHWRQLTTFLQDSSGAKTLSSESTGCFLVSLLILIVAWIITPYAHPLVGQVFQCLPSFATRVFSLGSSVHRDYVEVDQAEENRYFDDNEETKANLLEENNPAADAPSPRSPTKPFAVWIPLVLMVVLQVIRPTQQAYSYLSQTLALSPWYGRGHVSGVDLASLLGSAEYGEQCDSLAVPPQFDWLPEEKIAAFEDWYPTENGTWPLHYSPERDCSHVSNLENDFLDPIRSALRDNDVNVKHVVLIKLESTRKDVFPLVKDSFLWNHIAGTHQHNHIPPEVEEELRNLTKTIEYLTGDSAMGNGTRVANRTRGGISASDAFTASTYTLKSVTATLCGLMPLAADFNQEHRSHFYQPCMAHILNAFNHQLEEEETTDDFTTWPWQSVWMQSVTDTFDKQDLLTPALGFNKSITKETITSPWAKHFPPKSQDINYFGLPDTELKPYLRSAFEDAEAKRERLFITHLTGTTHHPWGVPPDFPFKDYLGTPYGHISNLNAYLNTIKFIDGWMADILDVLEETGVANDTLIVLAGDHGVSLPEDGGITPFDNPHVGVFHVPLIFSHPDLPPIKVDAPVSTMDALPTILDLLVSSASLDKKSEQVASDLLPFYEGQSLLRPLEDYSDEGLRSWHYTVLNSGGTWLAMRSTTDSYRVLVPLLSEVSWRFTDLESDPHETAPITALGWPEFIREVELAHGTDAVKWLNDSANAADWWLSKNHRLWHWEED